MLIRKLLALLILLSATPGFAQSLMWKHFLPAELSESTVTDINQDRDGAMWFATQAGLLRYNGIKPETISLSQKAQPYLNAVITDKRKKIYAGARDGLYEYSTLTKKYRKLVFPGRKVVPVTYLKWRKDSSELLVSTNFGAYVLRKNGKLELINKNVTSTVSELFEFDGHFYAKNGNKIISFKADGNPKTLYTYKGEYDFTWYPKNNFFLISNRYGLYKMTREGKISQLPFPVNNRSLTPEHNLFVDRLDKIWLNVYDTVYELNSPFDSYGRKHFRTAANPHSLHQPLAMFMDKDQNLWFSSSAGLRVQFLSAKLRNIWNVNPAELDAATIWHAYYDPQKALMLYGTDKGLKIARIGECVKNRVDIPYPKGSKHFVVTGIKSYDEKRWIVTAYGSGCWFVDKNTYKLEQVIPTDRTYSANGALIRKDGSVIICTTDGAMKYPKTDNQVFLSPEARGNLMSWTEDDAGNLYLGGSKLLLFDKKGKLLSNLFNQKGLETILTSPIFSMFKKNNGEILLGTFNNGMAIYQPKKKKVSLLDLLQKPTSIYGMVPLSGDEILFTSNQGIYKFNYSTGNTAIYSATKNLLPFNDFNQFGTSLHGNVVCFTGVSLIYGNMNEFEGLFSDKCSFQFEHKSLSVKKVVLQPGNRTLELQAGIGLKTIEHKPDIFYRIKSLENDWHKLDENGLITYNFLPPGDYEIEVKLEDPNKILKSESTLFPLEIQPFWYETFWSKAILYLLSLTALVLLFRYISFIRLRWKLRKLEADQKVNNERIRISRELHDNVGSQLSYLITGLEVSEMMAEKQNTEKLTQNLGNLQESARQSMQQLRDAIWALNMEAVSAADLTERFRQWTERITEPYEFTVRFTSEIPEIIQLDSLRTLHIFRILQESVHNVMKHSKATELNFKAWSDESNIYFELKDNGIGFEAATNDGSGLRNMSSRAKEMNGEFRISSTPGNGTEILLKVEINTPNG